MWLALSVPIAAVFVVRRWHRRRTVPARVLLLVGLGAYLGLGLILLKVLRPPLPTRQWPTELTPAAAALEAVQISMFYGTVAVGTALAVLLGLLWALRERTASALLAAAFWFVGAVLFVVVIASPFGTIRDALTGSWYNNWPRLAALFGVVLVPLAALGMSRTVDMLDRLWSRRRNGAGRTRVLIGAAAGVVGLLVMPLPAMPGAVALAHRSFVMDDDSALISTDEMALLQRLDEHVPPGAVIAGNPYTGAGLAYAIGGREVLMPHILVDVSDDMAAVNDHLAEAETMPAVCDAVERLGVGFVLDFGDREVHGGEHPLAGLEDLQDSGSVRLVDSQGDARLYEVTACGLG